MTSDNSAHSLRAELAATVVSELVDSGRTSEVDPGVLHVLRLLGSRQIQLDPSKDLPLELLIALSGWYARGICASVALEELIRDLHFFRVSCLTSWGVRFLRECDYSDN